MLKMGVAGLDDVLGGGLTPERLYLVEGAPGAGKTTVALQFLMEGVRRGERVMYITLSETATELEGVARSHAWDLRGIDICEMLPRQDALQPDEQYTMFHPSEVELSETTLKVLDKVGAIRPSRVVFDSLSELRLLAGSSLRYRRQILALKQFFAGRRCTVLLLDDMTAAEHDVQIQSISHAVLKLEQMHSDYGAVRRRLIVTKYRGQQYRDGYHDYKIVRGGLKVFPRLIAAEHVAPLTLKRITTGLLALDTLLGGGIEKGTSTLLMGAPGTGKSTIAAQFAVSCAQRGEHASLFIFDESLATLRTRCSGMNIALDDFLASGHIHVQQINPADVSPGEFVEMVRDAVTRQSAAVVLIDSLNGYMKAMPDERFLVVQLHELLTYLGQSGVATLLLAAQRGLIGMNMSTPIDASYLADAVVLLRYYEWDGEIRQAISVVKKRGGAHERTIRDLRLTATGIQIGEPLRQFRGILTGNPEPSNADFEDLKISVPV